MKSIEISRTAGYLNLFSRHADRQTDVRISSPCRQTDQKKQKTALSAFMYHFTSEICLTHQEFKHFLVSSSSSSKTNSWRHFSMSPSFFLYNRQGKTPTTTKTKNSFCQMEWILKSLKSETKKETSHIGTIHPTKLAKGMHLIHVFFPVLVEASSESVKNLIENSNSSVEVKWIRNFLKVFPALMLFHSQSIHSSNISYGKTRKSWLSSQPSRLLSIYLAIQAFRSPCITAIFWWRWTRCPQNCDNKKTASNSICYVWLDTTTVLTRHLCKAAVHKYSTRHRMA